MVAGTAKPVRRARVSFSLALAVTLAMAVAYAALDVVQPREPALSVLALLPGAISIVSLRAAGLTREHLRLRIASLSLAGAGLLAGVTVLMLPILSSSTGFIGWRWLPGLVFGPMSGIAQELYFRSSLLPALERAIPGRPGVALLCQAAVFVAFHLRTFMSVPSLPVALVIAVVILLAGCGWGREVQRDRTVAWATVQHCLFLAVMSMFNWG